MHRYIIYGFPIYIIIFEMVFRQIFKLDASSFIGPALASSGLSFIISNVKPKKMAIDESTLKLLKEKNQKITDLRDEKLITWSWILSLIGVFCWFLTCSYALDQTNKIWFLPTHFVIGIFIYIVGIIISSIKESL